jgi:hypothetical protein
MMPPALRVQHSLSPFLFSTAGIRIFDISLQRPPTVCLYPDNPVFNACLCPDARFGSFYQREKYRPLVLNHPDRFLAALEFALAAADAFFRVDPG